MMYIYTLLFNQPFPPNISSPQTHDTLVSLLHTHKVKIKSEEKDFYSKSKVLKIKMFKLPRSRDNIEMRKN